MRHAAVMLASLWFTGAAPGRTQSITDATRVMGAARNGDVFVVSDTDSPQVTRMRLTLQAR